MNKTFLILTFCAIALVSLSLTVTTNRVNAEVDK